MADTDSPLSPKAVADLEAGGGRHYRGSGLGKLTEWRCPGCGESNLGNVNAGCAYCPAGRPGTKMEPLQSRREPEGLRPPAARVSPLVAAAAPGAIKRQDLLDGFRQILKEEIALLFQPALGQLTLTAPAAYALRSGLELIMAAIENGAEDPTLPPPDELHALHQQLVLLELDGAPPTAPPLEEGIDAL